MFVTLRLTSSVFSDLLLCSLMPKLLTRSVVEDHLCRSNATSCPSREYGSELSCSDNGSNLQPSRTSSDDLGGDRSQSGVRSNAVGHQNLSPYLSPQMQSSQVQSATPADDMWLVTSGLQF